MLLALDIGNSQIFGGVFAKSEIILRFRRTSKVNSSSDELGVFLKNVLRENNINPKEITDIAISTVVPDLLHTLASCAIKYFGIKPFILGPGVKTGLNLKIKNPAELGADRVADAIGAINRYPKKNLIIIDFGTATTFCAITKNKEYLGGVILAGIKMSMEALSEKTALLPNVEITRPTQTVGRDTVTNIQSGLYFGTLGIIKELTTRIKKEENFKDALVIGTGGFARLFESEKVFDVILPDLVLEGLHTAFETNK
jgi:type III pantothenate kinase